MSKSRKARPGCYIGQSVGLDCRQQTGLRGVSKANLTSPTKLVHKDNHTSVFDKDPNVVNYSRQVALTQTVSTP